MDWWAAKKPWCDNNAKRFGHHCCTQPKVPHDKLFGESITVVVAGEKWHRTRFSGTTLPFGLHQWHTKYVSEYLPMSQFSLN
jgi:hypothetical protein